MRRETGNEYGRYRTEVEEGVEEEGFFGFVDDDVVDYGRVDRWVNWRNLDPFEERFGFDPARYLALLFHVWPTQIRRVLDQGLDESYEMNLIKKRSGKHRILMIPSDMLKWVQRQMLRNLLSGLYVRDDCHGFVPERSIVTAARVHQQSSYLLSLDLTDAFSAVTRKHVIDELRDEEVGSVRVGKWLAVAIAELCTTQIPGLDAQPRLPQGAPTSPALFNFACRELDRRVSIFVGKMGARYSRYADNLAISCDRPITYLEVRTISRIIEEKTAFRLNERKTRLMKVSENSSLQVLGISIRDGRLGLSKRKRRQLRGAIHTALREGDTAKAAGLLSLPRLIYGEEIPKQIFVADDELTMDYSGESEPMREPYQMLLFE